MQPSSAPDIFPSPGEIFAGKFRINRVIGSGGYAKVYLVENEAGASFAMKVMLPTGTNDPSAAQRFIREGKLLRSLLVHPHTIQVKGYGMAEHGMLYIVFEHINGIDLGEAIERMGQMPVELAASILKQSLESIGQAHSVNVLHRDIKPQNIMVSQKNGRKDWVTVLDFGVAQVEQGVVDQAVLTAAGTAVGTLRYMSPEGIRGEELGPDSDIYGLGLVAYELLTGTPAVKGETQMQMAGEQLGPQSFLIPASASIPGPLANIVNKMMRKDRKTRYQTTAEVLDDLNELDSPTGDATKRFR